MQRKKILTGIKPTGTPHIGNYFGMIKPALQLEKNTDAQSYFFIADYHALTTVKCAREMADQVKQVACTWLACGLDPKRATFYRQSDVPEIFELSTIISNVTAKGLMNRAHAYKASVAENIERGHEADYEVNMGLYTYPVLMAADIMLFDTDIVPVGADQKQHVEITADIAKSFNAIYGNTLKVPVPQIKKEVAIIPGLDGKKMSKSYNNVIPLFCTESELKKCVMRIVTDSSLPTDPKRTDCLIFDLYKLVASADKIKKMEQRFKSGIGWGDAKKELFDELNTYLAPMREKYNYYMANYHEVESMLQQGATDARKVARDTIARVRRAIGVSQLGNAK